MSIALPENIYLVGLMGAGKSTVGRLLARRLSKRFVDTDHEIEKRNGVTIPVIFEIEGEDGFRRREQEVLTDLTQEQGLVLSTGGGIVLRPENREALLNVEDPLTRLRQLHAGRDPLYREVAHAIVETGRGAPQQVVQAILAEITRIDR